MPTQRGVADSPITAHCTDFEIMISITVPLGIYALFLETRVRKYHLAMWVFGMRVHVALRKVSRRSSP